MISRHNPLHVSSCCCCGYRFWGGLSLTRVLWKSACARSNMKPKSIPTQARKWIEELFCWSQVLRQHFKFLSFCIHLHAFSFIFLSFACIFLSFCIDFLSCSFHLYSFPFIFLSFPSFLSFSFQCAFMSFHLPFIAFSFHFAFMSFHFLSRVMEMALWLGQETKCNKWLSLSYR